MKTQATKAAVLVYSALHESSQRKPQRGNTWRLVGWLDSTFELTLSGKSAKSFARDLPARGYPSCSPAKCEKPGCVQETLHEPGTTEKSKTQRFEATSCVLTERFAQRSHRAGALHDREGGVDACDHTEEV